MKAHYAVMWSLCKKNGEYTFRGKLKFSRHTVFVGCLSSHINLNYLYIEAIAYLLCLVDYTRDLFIVLKSLKDDDGELRSQPSIYTSSYTKANCTHHQGEEEGVLVPVIKS